MYLTYKAVAFRRDVIRGCALVFVLIFGTAACSGGGSSSSNNSSDDSDIGFFPAFVPEPGQPLADGQASVLALDASFRVLEEVTLQGQLQFGPKPGTAPLSTTLATSSRFVITSQPDHGELVLDDSNGAFVYTPDEDFFGTDSFNFYIVSDGLGSQQAAVEVGVENVNDAPELTVEFQAVAEQGREYRIALQGSDADLDNLVYSASNLPQWINFSASSGLLLGRPEQSDVGIYRDIRFIVTDEGGLVDEAGPFALEVLDVNDSPTVNADQFPAVLDAGERIVVNLFPDDPDGDFVRLQTEPNDFASVEILGGSLSLTAVQVPEVTTINLVVIATDLLGSTSREIIPITINPLTPSGLGRTLQGRRDGWGLHMVVLGDGYKSDEVNTFNEDVTDFIGLMKQDPSITTHFDAWNIHSVMQASLESGIDDDFSRDIRSTAFDSGYFCQGLQRLICANTAKVFAAALDEYPYLDQIVLLVNDNRYGGSGGSIAIASASAPEIALHELGHSIAGLADEYVDALVPNLLVGAYVEGRFANVSALDDPTQVPWAHWIDDQGVVPSRSGEPGIGLFQGAYYQENGFYRPTNNSRMRDNLSLFGPVNGEQWALSVYQRARPILNFSPLEQALVVNESNPSLFSVQPSFGAPIQVTRWFVDGREVLSARGDNALLVDREPGQYQVELLVEDVSGQIRLDTPNSSRFYWSWDLFIQ